MYLLNILFATLLSAQGVIISDSTTLRIDEVTVTANQRKRQMQMRVSQSSVNADRTYIDEHFQTSLAKSLESIAGVQASSIGSGAAKPAVRGMGFNRLAIIHDGIRHEGQQWGDDHGLEIDQFSIDRLEIIKGPAALLYGSDAVGGALILSSNTRPTESFAGSLKLFTRTNNLLFGYSARFEGKRNKFFWRANLTYQDFADYKVPTDSIEYFSYRIALHNQTLRNTAGREADAGLTLGYASNDIHTCIKLYETYSQSGFFANAHGLEVRLSDIDYDSSRRDIDLPKQSVNHLKILSHTIWHYGDIDFEGNAALQHNLRKEYSEPVAHGYMPKPKDSLERAFSKYTASINLSALWHIKEVHQLRFGLNSEFQHNRRSGWGYIIPDFENYSLGFFASERWEVKNNLALNIGLRYDYSHISIHQYQDWYLSPFGESGAYIYQTRSDELMRDFHSFTWSAGINYSSRGWLLKANICKGFRTPIAKELGADGINYHIFRYEQGNAELKPEESYQIDITAGWANRLLDIQIEPYFNYFPNYIYLDPTSAYLEGLQVYKYTQAQVVRAGFETEAKLMPLSWLELRLQAEYLFARQISGNKRGYGLPYSPPWRLMPEVKFKWKGKQESIGKGFATIDCRITGAQHDIVPPEKPTDGWWTLNMSVNQHFNLRRTSLAITLKAENMLNKKYYDHTSYYRSIDVPEAGWNLSAMLTLDF